MLRQADNKKIDLLNKARDYAFLLLKFRLRSEEELFSRLKKKGFEESIAKETVLFLKEKRFIDDNVFARAWVNGRLKKSLGLKRIKQELLLKTIDKQIIDREIEQVKNNYCEEDVVREVAKNRLTKLKGLSLEQKRRRLYAYLARRGFSSEIILDTVSKLCKQIS